MTSHALRRTGTFVVGAAVLCAVMAPLGSPRTDAVGWVPDTVAATGPVDPASVDVDATRFRGVAVWRVLDSGVWRVQAAQREGPGSWGPPVTVSSEGTQVQAPSVETMSVYFEDEDEGRQDDVAVWSGFDGAHWRVQYSVKRPGEPWTPPAMLSAAGQDAVEPVAVAGSTYVGDGLVTVAWRRFDGSNWRVQSSAISQSGTSFGDARDLSRAGGDAHDLTVTTWGSALAWSRFDGKNWRAQVAQQADRDEYYCCVRTVSPPGIDARRPLWVGYGAVWHTFDGAHWRVQGVRGSFWEQRWAAARYLSPGGHDAQAPVAAGCAATRRAVSWLQHDGSTWRVAERTVTEGEPWTALGYLSTAGVDASALSASLCPGALVAWIEPAPEAHEARAAGLSGAGSWSSRSLTEPSQDTVGVGVAGETVAWATGADPSLVRLSTFDNQGPSAQVRARRYTRSDPAVVRWQGGLDDWSSVASFRVRAWSIPWNQSVWSAEWLAFDVTERSWSGRLRGGSTYCFRARATDTVANLGPWSGRSCTVTPVDDRRLSSHGGWMARTGPGHYRSSYLEARRRGATLTLPPTRIRNLALLVDVGPGHGRLRVTMGGTTRTLNLDAPEPRTQVVRRIFDSGYPTDGRVRLTVTSEGAPVRVDGIYLGRVSLFVF